MRVVRRAALGFGRSCAIWLLGLRSGWGLGGGAPFFPNGKVGNPSLFEEPNIAPVNTQRARIIQRVVSKRVSTGRECRYWAGKVPDLCCAKDGAPALLRAKSPDVGEGFLLYEWLILTCVSIAAVILRLLGWLFAWLF